MTPEIIYIIGNGFDLHHGIKSSYQAFGEYVKQENSELHDTFEEYFSFEGNWSNLEDTLAHLDTDSIIDYAENFLMGYGVDDWSDSYHHDYQYEVNRIVKALSADLKTHFTNWVLSLQIPDPSVCNVPLVNVDKTSKFLNFNYTNTLQKLYKISSQQITHIHNYADNEGSNLILGHAADPALRKTLNFNTNLEDQDTRVTEANDIIDAYFSNTYKPTKEIIKTHTDWFNSLGNTQEIYVLGHSLSAVDVPYFAEIIQNTNMNNPSWTVSYYSNSSIPEYKETLLDLGIQLSKIKFVKLDCL